MNFLQTELERQMAAHREAKELVEVHGHAAYDLARERARRAEQAPPQADHWWCVTGIVVRRLGISQQPNPLTGYAEA